MEGWPFSNKRKDFLFLCVCVCMCVQYIDLILSPNYNGSKTWKLFFPLPSPFFCSPVFLLSYFLKNSYCFQLHHLLSRLLQRPLIGTQHPCFLDTPASVQYYFQKAELLCLNSFPLINIKSNILHQSSRALPDQVPTILSCLSFVPCHALDFGHSSLLLVPGTCHMQRSCHQRTFACAILPGTVSPPSPYLVNFYSSFRADPKLNFPGES